MLRTVATEFNLRLLVGSLVQDLQPVARDKGLQLITRISPDVPLNVLGDHDMLRQLLCKLLDNGVKFTQVGTVTLEVARSDGTTRHYRGFSSHSGGPSIGDVPVRFSVRDMGIGIPVDKHDSVFESFSQVDSSTTRKHAGMGIGLTIARHLARVMGGSLEVESSEGNGSEFLCTVPFKCLPSF